MQGQTDFLLFQDSCWDWTVFTVNSQWETTSKVKRDRNKWGTQYESGYCECNSASFKSFEQNISWCKDRPYVPCLCIVKKLGEVRFSVYNHAVGRRHRHMMSVVMGGDLWPPRSFATSLTQRHQTLNQFNWHWVGERDALKEERSKYM